MTAPLSGHIYDYYANAGRNSVPAIHDFLDQYGDEYVDALNENGNTALISAANGGHPEAVEALIARGADVNARGLNGFTPLTVALWMKQIGNAVPTPAEQQRFISVIDILLKEGADVRATDITGWGARKFCGDSRYPAAARHIVSTALALSHPEGFIAGVDAEITLPPPVRPRFTRGKGNAP